MHVGMVIASMQPCRFRWHAYATLTADLELESCVESPSHLLSSLSSLSTDRDSRAAQDILVSVLSAELLSLLALSHTP